METRTYTSTIEESTIVERVARIVSSVRGTKPDYASLATELEQAIPFDIFGVVLLRHDRQAARVIVCQRVGSAWIAVQHQHPREDSMVNRLLQNPVLLVKEYPDGIKGSPAESGDALSGYPQLRSTLIAPLMVEDRLLGTLELGSTAAHVYTDTALQRLIRAVVRVLAAAIDSAQMGGSAQMQDRQRQALKDVSWALTSKRDLATVLSQIVEGVSKVLEVHSAMLLLDRRGEKLYVEASVGLNHSALERIVQRQAPFSDTWIVGYTLRHHQPAVVYDSATDVRFPESQLFVAELGIYSLFCYPLVTGTTTYGALLLCSDEAGGFSPLKADILALFASQATIAMHNARLLEAAQQRSHFQQAIERLEQAYEQSRTVFPSSHLGGDQESGSGEKWREEEQKLLEHVLRETRNTFGLSFASLVRFISDHLLTQDEQALQESLSTNRQELMTSDFAQSVSHALQKQKPFSETLAILTQTAEAAVIRTGMLGELSRLLLQLQQSTNGVKDAWLVIALDGACVYMNPAAEALCEMHLEEGISFCASYLATSLSQEHLFKKEQRKRGTLKIEDVFAKLLPRIRNSHEVVAYLQDVTQEECAQHEVRCILAPGSVHAYSEPYRTQTTHPRVRSESFSSDYHYQFTRYPLYDQHQQLIAYALTVCDITEQVRDEKNRSTLLSSVSHDLRTPLTTIKAAVTSLLQTDVDWDEQDRRAMLEDIDVEADHLTVRVNALVEMSRIEMGALVLEKEWCDIVEIFHGSVTKLERVLAGRPLITHFQPNLPLVYVDHVQLERVFYNLLENAARRSPGHAELVVTVTVMGDPPKMLQVQVVDRGGVVPESECERMFRTFAHQGTSENSLGLAICRGIVEAHQGRIEAQPARDGATTGTCFRFTLPIYPQAAAQERRVGLRHQKDEAPRHRHGSAFTHQCTGEERP